MNLPQGVGMLINGVLPLTSASAAGLKAGDVITSVDGKLVGTTEQVKKVIEAHRIGDQVVLAIMHQDGTRQDVKITLGGKTDPPPPTLNRP